MAYRASSYHREETSTKLAKFIDTPLMSRSRDNPATTYQVMEAGACSGTLGGIPGMKHF